MSRYPNNQNSYGQHDQPPSNRYYYGGQSQVRHPPGALQYQNSRGFGSIRPRHFAPAEFGTVQNMRRNPNDTMQLRPASPNEQPWSHVRGQSRSMNENNSQHCDRFLQPINSNYNRTITKNEMVNGNPIVPVPPVPHWANTNTFQAHMPPSIPMPPPNMLPNTVHRYSTWGLQVSQQLGPPQHAIPHDFTWTPASSFTDHDKNKDHDFQEYSDSDRGFVENWLSRRNICNTVDQNKQKTIKINGLQKELQAYLKCVDELKTCRDVLMQFINTDEDNWQEMVKKTMSIKEVLEKLQSKVFQNEYIKGAVNIVKKRRTKRERQRAARGFKAKLKEEKQKRIILAHQRIDAWRHEIVSEINAKKMVDSLKSEAGQSLTEVRKKIFDFKKYLEKVDSAKELRGIRRQTALQRGIFIFGDQDEQFEKRIENMKGMIKKRLDVYNSEEKTLMVMLEEEKEQLQREDDKKRKKLMEKEHLRLFGYDPLVECRRYWLQAEVNPISLVQIRRLWDVYLVPSTMMGADRIPDGWVIPEPSENASWSKYLKRKS